MPEPQTRTDPENRTGLYRYVPGPTLQRRAGSMDAAPCLEHLQQVLRTVLTYLPRHVVRARLTDPNAPAVSGEFVLATLLFADISGFTAMSERLTQLGREGAEVIAGIVNDYFAAMLEIIARHDGDLFKFGGDALLVCFDGDNAAVRGCRAALEMQQAMTRFKVIHTAQGAFDLRMTAALASGRLFLVSLGSPDRLEFAVVGAPVERIARAEQLAQAGEVIIDQATYGATGEHTVATERATGFFHLSAMMPSSLAVTTEQLAVAIKDHADYCWLVERLDALTPYLPAEIRERIIASPGASRIDGEHRLVTVLFANFYGIDVIVEALGPDRASELTAILNRHFTAMRNVIHKYGGIVNKVDTYAVGYRIMGLFGAPVAHEDDPIRAVHAALEMQEAMASFADLPTSIGDFSLKQRIGINTGYVFAGNLGSTSRQEYSVMGDEVNLASRLMGMAAEGLVLVSQSTAEGLDESFKLHEHGLVKVKGKEQPVRSYQVLATTLARSEPAILRGDFFGRQKELERAQALVEEVLGGHGAVLDVSGEAGVGKSRLVAELRAYASERGMTVLHGEAVSYGRSLPYLPWSPVLHALLGLSEVEGEHPDHRREKLVAGLEQVGLSEWAPVVSTVLGIEMAETPLTASLDAQLRQQRFFDVILQSLQSQAARSPLLVVLDDMQWADASSLDLVAYVARNVGTSPLLLVIVRRPDVDSSRWCGAAGCLPLPLDELDEDATLILARSVLGGGELSPSLRRVILERAQGNPLFVEEVTRAMSESGVIQRAAGENDESIWNITDDTSNALVPTTLTGLIMSRIDRLEPTSYHLLQVAAVIGVAFRSSMLARSYAHEDIEGTLGVWLDKLVELDLLSFSPPEEYTFRHTLTQEVAYESLSFARRRELHVRVGEDIERSHATDPSGRGLAEYYGVLARHFEKGQVMDKAFLYLVKAGDRARLEFANEAALDNYRRALRIASERAPIPPQMDAQVLDVLQAMGEVYLLIGRYAEAIEQFQRAIAHPLCTQRRRGDLLHKTAKAHELQGLYEDALRYLAQGQKALSRHAEDRHSPEMARIHNLAGWVRMRRAEMDGAIEDCERGLAILAGLSPDQSLLRDEADLHNTLGAVYVGRGHYSRAAEAYRRSTELREQAGDLPGMASCYNNLALTSWGQGDLAGASDYLQRSMDISRKIGNNHALGFVYNNLGAVSYTMGDVAGAIDYYHAALSLRQRIGDNYGVAQTYSNLGEALVSLERYDEARLYLEQAATAFQAIQSEGELPEVYCLLATIELAQQEFSSALDHARQACSIAAATGNPELQGIAERIAAQGQAQSGDVARAREAFEASIALLSESENHMELARSHHELALLLIRQGHEEKDARHHLEAAAAQFDLAGAEQEAAQARTLLPGSVNEGTAAR